MEPAHARAIGRVDNEIDHHAPERETGLDRLNQRVGALPGDGRNQHRPLINGPPLGQVFQPDAAVGIEPIDLVPDLDQALFFVGIDAERAQHIPNVLRLCLGVLMRDVAHMQDHVGLNHLLQRGAEGRDQHGRQVGDEAHGVGQDDLEAARQLHGAQGRIERREQHVGFEQYGRFASCRLNSVDLPALV